MVRPAPSLSFNNLLKDVFGAMDQMNLPMRILPLSILNKSWFEFIETSAGYFRSKTYFHIICRDPRNLSLLTPSNSSSV